ncbi:MAG: CDF family Co(II)/Ni(II) efflux transporter DmeF [Steroidobacteraceae bacterium]
MSEHNHCTQVTNEHGFDAVNPLAERRTRWVVILTAATMVVELLAGWRYGSMALLADGWHMSSHVIALGLSVAAYALARRLRRDVRFAFGTWKIEVLGGYTSALLLAGVVVLMGYECVTRLVRPLPIAYDEALLVATLGLIVNLLSAWMLSGAAHGSDAAHGHAHEHRHGDPNLRSAYVHVAADAATSLFAIGALAGGKYLHIGWLDAGVGLLGSGIVAAWAVSLLRSTGRLLLDADMDAPVVAEIRRVVRESTLPAELDDLHVWRVGKGRYACILSVTAAAPATPAYFRSLLRAHSELVHVTVEVNQPAVA